MRRRGDGTPRYGWRHGSCSVRRAKSRNLPGHTKDRPNAEHLRVAGREVQGSLPIAGPRGRCCHRKHASASRRHGDGVLAGAVGLRRGARCARSAALRDPRRRHRHRRGPRLQRRARAASALCPGGVRRHHHQYPAAALGAGRRQPPPALDAERAPQCAARAPGDRQGALRGRGRRRLLDRCRHRPARGGRDDQAAAPRVRRRAAGPRAGRGAVRAAAHALRDGHGAAGARAAGVAVLPALSPRAVRRLRPALGWPGGRCVRARGPPLRRARRRRPAAGMHPARPRRRDAVLPARLHGPAARSPPQPRLPHEQRLARRRRRRLRRVRAHGAALARGGRPAHRGLLRRRVRTDRRGTCRAGRDAARGAASPRRGVPTCSAASA